QTYAYIDGGRVLADDNIVINADSFTQFDPEAGGFDVSLGVAVGVAGSLLMKADDTRAFITNGAMVDAKAMGDAVQVYTGEKVLGIRIPRPVKGVALTATNLDETDAISVGGAVGLGLAVAGSGNGIVLKNHVAAYIDAGAKVNKDDAGAS